MSVSPEQSARYLISRRRKREQELDVLHASMRSDAKRIIEAIVRDFGPTRIYQWGSLLDRSRFRPYSDIDIAVEGIRNAAIWLVLEERMWNMTDYPLDLVRFERIEPEYAEIIRAKGVLVYERSN